MNSQSTVGAACDIISQTGFCADADQSQTLEALLNSYDPASMQAFELTRAISKIDSFSEDARFLHAMVPDGAAASVPDGMARNFEFRSLIQSLHKLGLQVFIDAPYNSAAEEASLNEVVPNYYNTRETPVMEARYKQDALKVWTNEYKIDGFIERPSNSNLVLLSGKDNRQLIPPRPAGSLTLWDGLQTQNPDMAADTLMRLQVQALSNSLLSRNITYIKMGDDILRSRSFLPSGNIHGEWYNAVDFSLASNNSNKGAINETTGPGIASPSSELIQQSSDMVRSLMVMRSSSPLFALANPEEIQKRVRDIDPADGLSVRIIDDGRVDETLENLDPHVSEIIILRNTAARPQSFKVESAARLRLHPAQINGTDPLVLQSQIKRDSITIPAYTTAVFVRPE